MKRYWDNMDISENKITTDADEHLQISKKSRADESLKINEIKDVQMQPSASRDHIGFFDNLKSYGHHSFVEREPNPNGVTLVNPNLVGKKTYQEAVELGQCFSNAALFTECNTRNKVDMIGLQMKYLQDTLHKVVTDTKRDSELHMAACNFVKKAGQIYHLYERHSGQKYFSMLSPGEWAGSPPHKFLGSFLLESDQSWTPAEEAHLRYQGISFLRQLYMDQKAIQ